MISRLTGKLHTAATFLSLLAIGSGQNESVAGPPWIESEFASSPPVYPSRE